MIELDSLEMLERMLQASQEKVIMLLKHSNTCPISSMAFESYKALDEAEINHAPRYLVVVQKHRELSQQIATTLKVAHQSPQLIVIRGAEAQGHISHYQIRPKKVLSLLSEAAL
ncbi:MAG: bacillithiol system redox-active protein YtxJ [Deinococcales bacterium]